MTEEALRAEFKRAIEPLVIAMGAKFDAATYVLYFQALSDVPLTLLRAAVTACAKSDRRFMPRPGELRKLAEDARLALSAAMPFEACAECENGWLETPNGLVRCVCWLGHQRQLSDAGVTQRIALPAGEVVEA